MKVETQEVVVISGLRMFERICSDTINLWCTVDDTHTHT